MGSVETHAKAALALAIILLITQMIMAIFLFKVWRSGRPARRPADAERGLDLQDASRGMSTGDTGRCRPQNPPRAAPAPALAPVGPSSAEALGRPVAAYQGTRTHGENEDYYNPSPISRRPTYTVDSGRGEQTYGTDYTKVRREPRERHNTNVNDANYGRKGNKFAHGT